MPRINVETKVAKKVWESADGSRKIFELTLDYEGKPVKAKTYSGAIAAEGWKGTVDTYEKPSRNGLETFVKQPPKEDGSYGKRPGNGKPNADPFTMYLSYAKDIAIAVLQAKDEFDVELYKTVLKAAGEGGKALYKLDPSSTDLAEPDLPKPDPVIEVKEDTDLSKVLGEGIEQLNLEEENPWNQDQA